MMLEHRIAQLEERLANAQLIDKRKVDTSIVSVGAVVRLRDVDAKETTEYFIVGSAEANPAERKLNESPVGKAIMGRKKGETVEVVTPRGSKVKFKIMETRPRSAALISNTGRSRVGRRLDSARRARPEALPESRRDRGRSCSDRADRAGKRARGDETARRARDGATRDGETRLPRPRRQVGADSAHVRHGSYRGDRRSPR